MRDCTFILASRGAGENIIRLTCKYKRNKQKLANPLGEIPIGQKKRAGLNITDTRYETDTDRGVKERLREGWVRRT